MKIYGLAFLPLNYLKDMFLAFLIESKSFVYFAVKTKPARTISYIATLGKLRPDNLNPNDNQSISAGSRGLKSAVNHPS